MREPIFGHFPVALKLLMLLMIIIASLLLSTLLAIVLAIPFYGTDVLEMLSSMSNYENPASLNLLKLFQVINQIGLFVLPSVLFAFLVYRSIPAYMKLNVRPKLTSVLLGSVLIILSLPFIGWLAEINQQMDLPDSLSGIESWMKASEEQARILTEAFLSTKSFPAFLFNLLMIAIIPAIGEEMLFRGILIRLFKDWTNNLHLAVIISSILFSALHMQFFGFLPRLVLGMMLAYLFVWSGSLWLPVIVHFVNNAFAVTAIYLSNHNVFETDMETLGTTDNALLITGSLVAVILLLVTVKRTEGHRG